MCKVEFQNYDHQCTVSSCYALRDLAVAAWRSSIKRLTCYFIDRYHFSRGNTLSSLNNILDMLMIWRTVSLLKALKLSSFVRLTRNAQKL